ncbi:MAG: SIR2 family protein [Polyangiaceae bacterium]|nr:SIR2 family protein [Polyangiaceae bacterium]
MSFDWSALLSTIHQGKVIPVIGRDLIELEAGQTFDRRLAAEVAARFNLPESETANLHAIEDVAAAVLRQDPENLPALYSTTREVLAEMPAQPPQVLRDLVAISGFRVFLTTTLDRLLVQALQERYPQNNPDAPPTVVEQWYAPEHGLFPNPSLVPKSAILVIHLFGRPFNPSGAPPLPGEFVVTEADRLELFHQLQAQLASNNREVRELSDLLRSHDLLLLGCGFPDWLMRFGVRVLRGKRFGAPAEHVAQLAEYTAAEPLVAFLQQYGIEVHTASPVDFVRNLVAAEEGGRQLRHRVMLANSAADDPFCSQVAQLLTRWNIGITRVQWENTTVPAVRPLLAGCALHIPLLSNAALSTHRRRIEDEFKEVERQPGDLSQVVVQIDEGMLNGPLAINNLLQGRKVRSKSVRPTAQGLAVEIAEQLAKAQKLPNLSKVHIHCVHAPSDQEALRRTRDLLKQYKWATATDRTEAPPGADVAAWVANQMNQAQVLLLLVTARLLADAENEIAIALQLQEARSHLVVLLLVEACDWQPTLGALDSFPADQSPVNQNSQMWTAASAQLRFRVIDHLLSARQANI